MSFRSLFQWAAACGLAAALVGCGTSDQDPQSNLTAATARPAGAPGAIEAPVRDLSSDRYDRIDENTGPMRPVRYEDTAHQPQVVLATTAGDITIKLYRDRVPMTVDNFLEYVTSGFYNGKIFHQVETGFIAAAGGYTSDLKPAKARAAIRNEAHKSLPNRRGTVAMVRLDEIDSATSQFLINLADNKPLDHKSRDLPPRGKPDQYGYCVFGEIVQGWDIVEKIARAKVQPAGDLPAVPVEPIVIKSARIATTGGGATANRVKTAQDGAKRYE
jgi:cyclophilin family peptidyl-prolyl cis-trans isomerase